MPVPKRKRSRVRRDKRFANKGVQVKAITGCKTCTAPLVPHVVCASCGHYKGVKVVATKQDRAQKRAVVMQAKQASKKQQNNQQDDVNSRSA
jgi:large subunit ribosomal protein L32